MSVADTPGFKVMARRIFQAALAEDRAAELLNCLFEDGTATVDFGTGKLVLMPLPPEIVSRDDLAHDHRLMRAALKAIVADEWAASGPASRALRQLRYLAVDE